MKTLVRTLVPALSLSTPACLEDEVPAPTASPRVFFVSPSTGDRVGRELHVELAVTDFTVKPAGATGPATGYLTLFVDEPCATAGDRIVGAPTRVVLDRGELEADVSLDVGRHVLCAQASDGEGVALSAAQLVEIEVIEARVSFVSPQYGAAIGRHVRFELASEGIEIEPAGELRPGAGHYYLVLDAPSPEVGAPIADAPGVLALSAGESVVELDVSLGFHEVWLGVADGLGVALEPRTRVQFHAY